MTIKRAIIKSLIYFTLIFGSIYLYYKKSFQHLPITEPWKFLDIVTSALTIFLVLICIFSIIPLSISLTRILIPIKTNFDLSILKSKEEYKIFENAVGSLLARVVNIAFIAIFFSLFLGIYFFYFYLVDKYESYHLDNFGVTQKVEIKLIRHYRKSSRYAVFNYYLNGKLYENQLSSDSINAGDSVFVIFSKEDPNIIEWKLNLNKILNMGCII